MEIPTLSVLDQTNHDQNVLHIWTFQIVIVFFVGFFDDE